MYPFNNTVLPPEISAQQFTWMPNFKNTGLFKIEIKTNSNTVYSASVFDTKWQPDSLVWEKMKSISKNNLLEFSVMAKQKVTKAPFIRYEIGTFSTTNGNKYKYLAIYETYNNTELRVFESIIQCSKNPANIRMLEQRRIDWANGASSHNVKSFINDLYASNALYYSQSNDKLSLGSKSIIETFAYMNDPRYTFDKLESIHSEAVNEEIILEIGTWKMPYNSGEYVIIWKLCSDNVWRILIDSNF